MFLLLGVVFRELFLDLLQDGEQSDIAVAAGAVSQHLLHGFEDTGGVLTELMDRREVLRQHVEYIQGILIIILVDLLLVMIDVLLQVAQQVVRHLGVVDDIVHGVEDAVNEAFGQFTHRRHLLLTDQLMLGVTEVGCTFLDDTFQLHLLLLQPLQAIAEQEIDHKSNDEEVEHHHIPAHQQRIGDAEINGGDL